MKKTRTVTVRESVQNFHFKADVNPYRIDVEHKPGSIPSYSALFSLSPEYIDELVAILLEAKAMSKALLKTETPT